ncbi:MAG TPA: hypothetical protein DIS90_14245 [Cytophagales bacterium]|nr:hypothetical protein [Cytophagales bacterium]HCR53678.1 hypothetical protein [Cytophagales bacterium]
MKHFRSFSLLLTLFFILALVVRCSDDNPAPVDLSTISGKVTYPDGSGTQIAAAGAIVTLFSTTPVLNMEVKTDENGNFNFANLEAGTYTLSAYYDTDNTNNAGRLSGLRFTIDPTDVVITNADATMDMALVSSGQAGIPVININFDWTGSAFANTGVWAYDQTHSPIQFEFPYRDNVAEFVGAFSQVAELVVNFDPANLASSNIVAEIDLASINTRSLGGRDPKLASGASAYNPNSVVETMGCIMGTFGISADGTLPSTITSTARYAKFTSTSIVAYGDGYLAKGNLVFNGVTKAVEMWFKAVTPWNNGGTPTATLYSGFEGRFFMGKTDFNIGSSSVGENIRIQVSIVATKPA